VNKNLKIKIYIYKNILMCEIINVKKRIKIIDCLCDIGVWYGLF